MTSPVLSGWRLLLVSAAVTSSIGLLSCGGDDDGGGDGGGGSRAEEIAACAEDAGFDPTISEVEGATAVDLTTRTATILLHVFESESAAMTHESSSGLDSERVGSVQILGGAIPPDKLAKIKVCISAG